MFLIRPLRGGRGIRQVGHVVTSGWFLQDSHMTWPFLHWNILTGGLISSRQTEHSKSLSNMDRSVREAPRLLPPPAPPRTDDPATPMEPPGPAAGVDPPVAVEAKRFPVLAYRSKLSNCLFN